jgi:hypothetical protein
MWHDFKKEKPADKQWVIIDVDPRQAVAMWCEGTNEFLGHPVTLDMGDNTYRSINPVWKRARNWHELLAKPLKSDDN